MKKKDTKFVYITPEGNVTLRFVGEPVRLFQYYKQEKINGPIQPFLQYQYEPPFFRKDNNGDKNYIIRERIATLVIDRNDDKIKTFSCPISVWDTVSKDPEYDYRIERIGSGIQTRYDVTQLCKIDLTEEQKNMVEFTLEKYSIENIFINKIEWDVVLYRLGEVNRFDLLDF